ncbi:MAG TPA: amino acid adenylation domain-containing protein [Longimicrobium sp.]|nr:amino acid adenylation domain-containing protein [Longimicrobium sp.]
MTEVSRKLSDLTPEQRKLLALRLRMQKAKESAPAPQEREGGVFPLSFAQQRLWLLDRLEPGATAYNMAFARRLRGPVDVPALERALAELVRRHETLRTRIDVRDGEPVQVVEPFGGWILPVIDRPIPDAERETEFRELATDEANRAFDLAAGPPFRAVLVRAAADDHLLLYTLHHIVSDGWSTGVFDRELKALYEAFMDGRPSPLEPLPLQYGDFAVRQRARLSGEALERQVAWWKERLAGAPALLELPTDRPRPAVRSDRGDTIGFELADDLAPRVDALARAEDATPFMVMLAAWQALLSRWSGQDDVLVGTPIANRTTPDVEGLIGYFANTLVLRGELSGDPTFRELLARVRDATLGAYEHQDLPFEKLVEEINPERSLSHTPLFQVAIVLQNLGGGAPAGGPPRLGLAIVEYVGRARESARFDLMLTVLQEAGRTTGHVEYAADLWEPETVKRMLGHFAVLINRALAEPETRLSDLPLLRPEERAELEARARPAASFAVDAPLHVRFAQQAARTPAAVAVTYEGTPLTYAELDTRANRLAHHLVSLGAAPGDLVGLCVERSLETVIGILAILKAGAAYLPLDPAYPDERIAHMLEDSGTRIVITTSDLQPRVAGDDVKRVVLDHDAAEIDAHPSEAPRVEVQPAALAYVIYTSGSTGRPKGVQVTHANVVRLFTATDAWFGFGADDVWTLFHSYAFDFSVWEIWGALLYGGRLVIVPFYVSRNPEAFYELVATERVTVLNQTPSAFRQLMRADEDAVRGGAARDLALRAVIFGGEALDPASLRGWVERRGDDLPVLVNMYGITETTVHVTYRVIRRADVMAGSASPIGVPIPDLSVQVLDRRGRMVPVGVVGEMYVGGAGVARGYLNRPELTAQRFVPDPAGDPNGRLYRSGDLARWLPDGGLEFFGRADDQVKVRGFRIELGEIESVLLEHSQVREAVVLARGSGDEKRLVAWIVSANGDAPATAELRAHLGAHLPDYMVPSAFVAMDALPLTRNGKVDRRALPKPDLASSAAEYVPPRTPTEVALAEIWAALLGAERVGAEDGFFVLGGHSLLATRVLSRVREAFGVELPLRAVFESPTLSALAAEIDRLRGTGEAAAPPIVPVDRTGDLPLSFAQERLWFVDRLEPGSPVYTMGSVYRLSGALNAPAVERALAEIVRRHESLRTIFPEAGGLPVQRVIPFTGAEQGNGAEAEVCHPEGDHTHPAAAQASAARRIYSQPSDIAAEARDPSPLVPGPTEAASHTSAVQADGPSLPQAVLGDGQADPDATQSRRIRQGEGPAFHLPQHDLTALPGDTRRAEAERLVRAPFTDPFDLARGPLLRAVLVKMGEAEHLFAFNLHHVVGDGWSLGIFFDELATLYAAFAADRPSPLPDLPVQYGDYAAWQRDWLRGEVLERQLAYWRDNLAGAPPLLELPTDRPRPALQSYRGAAELLVLPPDEVAALHALGQGEGATLFMTLLAAFSLVLSRLSGQDDVVVGTPIAGRTRAETERLIGLFLNSLALRTDLSGDPSFRELLRRVRKTTLDAYAHQDLPFERLLDELQPRRSLSHTPVFQVMLNLENYGGGSMDFAGVEVEAYGRADEQTSKFDLTLYAMETPDGLVLRLVYAHELFDAERMREMLSQFRGILTQAAAQPDTPAARVSLLSGEARAVLPTPAEPLSNAWRGSVPELFVRRSAATPHALAVEDPRERWNYEELDRASARIANRLLDAGVQPGDVVAIWGHRSAALARALLGTLRSGAAFLVLDPAYPSTRIIDYLRVAKPVAFLRLASAVDVPDDVASALAETTRCTITLGVRALAEQGRSTEAKARHPEGDHTVAAAAEASAARRIYSRQNDIAAEASNQSLHAPGHAEAAPHAGAVQAERPSLPQAVLGEGQAEPDATQSRRLRQGEGLHGASSDDDLLAAIDGLSAASPEAPAVTIGPDTLAYLSFTSGTTGTPKAVMGRHGSLTHFTPWLAETFGLTADDRFSMLSGIAHDPLHRDVFTPLQLGASVIAPEADEVGAPGYLARWLREAVVTVAHLTPAMGQLIADVPGGVEAAEPVPSLRRAFFVGDVLTRGDVERLRRLAPNLTVINYYGSTETQRAVAYHVVRTGDDREREVIPLGRGIPGVQLLVRNAAGELAGIGEVGEIWLRSPHVALGYLNDAGLTEQRFVHNPWTQDAGDLLYRTGDLGRYRPDGEVEPMGRADQQVKVRGFRVELGEIEAHLARHPSVREAVVIARGDGADKRLVAYVVPNRVAEDSQRTGAEERHPEGDHARSAAAPSPAARRIYSTSNDIAAEGQGSPSSAPDHASAASHPGASQAGEPSLPQVVLGEGQAETGATGRAVPARERALDVEALRAHLRAALPDFMVPAAFVTLERLPLTQNAKVDRRALPEPEAATAETRIEPRTETEAALAEIWSEVLGHEVGVEDDFFASGGHSLRATQVLSRVQQRFGIRLPVKTVFAAPTVAALAGEIDARRTESSGLVDEVPADWGLGTGDYPSGVYPLSFAQQRLWVLDRLDPGSAAYNLPAAYRIHGALNAPALERALSEIIRRHETLRTRIDTRGDDEAVQVVDPAGDFHLPVIDRLGISDDELRTIASDEAARPFDLARGPLFRALLVRIAEDDHALLWTLHHAISDGWSSGVLLRELNTLYDAFAAGRPSPLPPLPVQYGVHAARQRHRLSGEALDAQVHWWKEALSGAPSLLELPADRPRPAVQSYRGATLGFGLPDELMARVDELARKEGATPFMVLLAAFDGVLSRWSGQDDVVVGTPIANRTSADVEPLIGFFANTLALRGDLRGDPTFAELLARVKHASLGAFDHQELPFEKLVEELQPERSLSHSPVFQLMFALQNVPREGPRLGGLDLAPIGRQSEAAKFDLSLTLVQTEGQTYGAAEYASDLFDAATVERFVNHFATLLDAATRQPHARIADLPLMPPEERGALLAISAGPAVDRNPSLTLPALFAAQVARTPNAVALTFGGRSMTYSELDAESNALARHLRTRGVGAETPVAVFVERSPEMVIALYGVVKAGGYYVPVDPEYPADRIAYMLEDSGARLVLTSSGMIGDLPGDVEALALDGEASWDKKDDSVVDWEIDPDALAYVIYTSGSTGRPKGAGNAHRGIVNRILWMQETFGLTPNDVVLQKTPFSFDVSVWEFFWPLMAGARLAIAAPGVHRDPAALSHTIRGEGVTTLHFVPSMLQLWLDDASAAECGSPRTVMASGEALPGDLRDRFFARLPGVALHNLYGPTEAAVDVTWHPCTADERGGAVPIGRPVANTRIHVLDPRGAVCPVGVPGELHIAGVQVGRGYQGRPALAAERFVPDPFAPAPGARMYRTGDRARWTAAGELEYLGRFDFQVKLRGLRVELGEIEAALAADPSVREAVVTAHGSGDEARLVAYVVEAEGGALSVDGLRERLGRTLPPYMVPGVIIGMDALPLTPSGKVDRKALPEPGARVAGQVYVAPWSPTEIELADVWRDVLGVERVGAADDFFALGGHSLLAVKLASRIRQRFGRELPLAELFRSPTLRALAIAIDAGADDAPASPLVALHAAGDRAPIFCVHPAGGTVFRYTDLARHLGVDQPFYGLQARGVNDESEPLRTVDEMADLYFATIRATFPRGPYVLAGWSAGGTIGYEIARRLRDAGEEVPLVVLLDTHGPKADWQARSPDEVDLYLHYTHDLAGVAPERLEVLEGELRATSPDERIAYLADWIARTEPSVPEATVAQIARSVRVFATTMRAVNEHQLREYDGDVLLIEAALGIPGTPAPEGGVPAAWRAVVRGRFEVRTVPGSHGTLVSEPYVAEVARELAEVLGNDA